MAIQKILIKRGLDSNRTSVTPDSGEFLWTTDLHELWVGDGSTAGGIKVTQRVEDNYIPNTEKGAANGVATLGSDAKIPTAQLPALAITDVYTADSESAQLALDAQEGDVCVRTDENKSYVHNGGTAGDMTDWQELLSPTDAVQSVNGQTGNVVLTTDDISEGTTNLYYTDTRVDNRINATSIDALADVDTTTSAPSTGQALKWDGTNWVPQDDTGGAENFTELNDTPTDYSGAGGQVVKVAENESGLTFSTLYLTDIADVTTGAEQTGDVLKWSGSEWNNSPLTFTDLSDTPTGYTETDADKFLRINTSGDAIVFSTPILNDIGDVSASPNTGDLLSWDGSVWTSVAPGTVGAKTFVELTDTPSDYSGNGGYSVRVKSDESGIEFVDDSVVDLGTF